MSTFILNDEDEKLPPLVPIKKKKGDEVPQVTPSEKGGQVNSIAGKFLDEASKMVTPTGKDTTALKTQHQEKKKEPDVDKIRNLERKFNQKTSTTEKKNKSDEDNTRTKQNLRSKMMIHEMLNKLSVKNLTEELYPVSNEVIDKMVNDIDDEIEELKLEIEKKQVKLAGNQSNKEATQEMGKLKRSVHHCETIKQLYLEKIKYRNKIAHLESTIIDLKNDNKSLKIKITKGIETIENYKKGLPSDEEKQLKEKLKVCMSELQTQREMRQNLQKNIEHIIKNFKRLYEEADSARVIITTKLRDLEERERKLEKAKAQKGDEESEQIASLRRINTVDIVEDRKFEPAQLNQTTYRKNFQNEKKQTVMKVKTIKQENKSTKLSMEEQIKKMRSNQAALSRFH